MAEKISNFNQSKSNGIQEEEDYCSIESNDPDSIHSGESLLKTFTFIPKEDSPELKKCIAFWHKILAKKLKPVKCNLITAKPIQSDTIPPTQQEDHDDMKIWHEALAEIKHRKLDRVKLLKPVKEVDCCEILSQDYIEKITRIPAEEKREIIELNEWQSRSCPITNARLVNDKMMKVSSHRSQHTKEVKEKWSKVVENAVKNTAPEDEHGKTEADSEMEIQNVVFIEPEEEQEEKNVSAAPYESKLSEIAEESEMLAALDESIAACDEEWAASDCGCVHVEQEDKMCQCGCQFANCYCDDVNLNVEGCICGCDLDSCACEAYNKLRCECSCGLLDCTCGEMVGKSNSVEKDDDCNKVDEIMANNAECTCGCGLEECECSKLIDKSHQCDEIQCYCGSDCVCSISHMKMNSEISTGTTDSTEDIASSQEQIWNLIDAYQKGNKYCTICGYFDCYCNK